MDARIEKEAAEALLDRGVSVPFKDIRLPFKRQPLQLRLTMRRPTLDAQIHIARLYLEMDVTTEEMRGWPKRRQMQFMAEHGKGLSRIMAYTVCRGYVSRRLFIGVMAWVIRNFVAYRYQIGAVMHFEALMGTDPFMNIIRSAERTNPMKPRLSRRKKGS